MSWNEQDATIIELQTALMRYQAIIDELKDENDDLIDQLADNDERIYELESHPHRYHRLAATLGIIALIQTINLLICLL